MSKTRIAFILITGLFCLGMLPGAVGDLLQPEMVLEIMAGMGLPPYILTLLGILKLLGIVALALPRFRRINEWAYAGFVFDLTGAVYCHLAGGDAITTAIPPLVLLVPLAASYMLRDRVRATAESGVMAAGAAV